MSYIKDIEKIKMCDTHDEQKRKKENKQIKISRKDKYFGTQIACHRFIFIYSLYALFGK